MANNKTVPQANDVLRFFLALGAAAPTRPTNLYMALFTGVGPGESGAATNEVPGAIGYARQLITFATESAGSTSNNNTPAFGPATASWGTVTYGGICKSNVQGTADVIYYFPLTTPRLVNIGQSFVVAVGAVVGSED